MANLSFSHKQITINNLCSLVLLLLTSGITLNKISLFHLTIHHYNDRYRSLSCGIMQRRRQLVGLCVNCLKELCNQFLFPSLHNPSNFPLLVFNPIIIESAFISFPGNIFQFKTTVGVIFFLLVLLPITFNLSAFVTAPSTSESHLSLFANVYQ